jgi:regulator of RNase E activity RraA
MTHQDEKQLLARCAQIGVSALSDAMDELGIQGVLHGIVQRAGTGRMAGFAVTARHAHGEYGDFERSEFAVGRLVEATGPGKVLMVDVDGAPISTFGGNASVAAAARGATAVVIDGACRDVDEIREAGLWMASRWVAPTTGKTRLSLRAMGEPVTIGGVRVEQGDLVVGDDTGLAVVPRGRLAQVLERAEGVLRVDDQVLQGIRNGLSFAQAAASAGYIPDAAGATG